MCSEPGGVLHARRTGAVFPYQLHDQILYTCDPCYPGGGTITCLMSGMWSPFPDCEQSKFVFITCSVKEETNVEKEQCATVLLCFSHDKKFVHCAVCNYFSCPFFADEEVECPDPGTIKHGVRDPPNGTFFCGDQVAYVCDIGYEPRGDSVAQCTETGEFNKKPPECVIAGEYIVVCLSILCCRNKNM